MSVDYVHAPLLQANVTLLSTKTPEELAVTVQKDILSLTEAANANSNNTNNYPPPSRLQRDKSKKYVPSKTTKGSVTTTKSSAKLKKPEYVFFPPFY